MYSIWLNMFKIASVSEAPPIPPWGAYDFPPDPLVVGASCLRQSQLRAFGVKSLFPPMGSTLTPPMPMAQRHPLQTSISVLEMCNDEFSLKHALGARGFEV